MQAALPALNDEFRATWGIELQNHIGVNTGEVIAGDASLGQRLVTGDAVNTAARLEQAAGAREIVLGELTYRLARDQIEVEADPAADPQGQGRARRRAYRLVRGRARPNAERASVTTPFVGREAEMDRLEMTLLEVGATRSCELLTVVGDAGVGKSRLDPRVRDPGLGQRAQPGPPRPLPAVRRRRHVLADRRDRPQRGGHQRRGPARRRARQDRRHRARRGRPDRRSGRGRRPGRRRDRPVRRPSSPGRSCSGGSASCSRRSPAGARWSRSSTTSTSRRRRSSSCSTTCSTPCTGPRSCCWPRPGTSCSRRAAEWAEGHEASTSCSSRSRPTTPSRSSTSCSAGLDGSVRRADPGRRRRQPAVRRADRRRCSSRPAPFGARATAGSPRRRRARSPSRRPSRPSSRPASMRSATRSGR